MKGNWKVIFFRGNIAKEDAEVSVYIYIQRQYRKEEVIKSMSSDCSGGWGSVTQGRRMPIQERHLFICS